MREMAKNEIILAGAKKWRSAETCYVWRYLADVVNGTITQKDVDTDILFNNTLDVYQSKVLFAATNDKLGYICDLIDKLTVKKPQQRPMVQRTSASTFLNWAYCLPILPKEQKDKCFLTAWRYRAGAFSICETARTKYLNHSGKREIRYWHDGFKYFESVYVHAPYFVTAFKALADTLTDSHDRGAELIAVSTDPQVVAARCKLIEDVGFYDVLASAMGRQHNAMGKAILWADKDKLNETIKVVIPNGELTSFKFDTSNIASWFTILLSANLSDCLIEQMPAYLDTVELTNPSRNYNGRYLQQEVEQLFNGLVNKYVVPINPDHGAYLLMNRTSVLSAAAVRPVVIID